MKRTVIILFIAIFICGCGGGGDGDTAITKAVLEIIFSPNPVVQSEDGNWYFLMTITENYGIGVEVTEMMISYYRTGGDLSSTQLVTADEFAEWFVECGGSGTRIEGGSSRCSDLYIELSSNSGYAEFTVYGIDDLGNEVSGSAQIVLEARSKEKSGLSPGSAIGGSMGKAFCSKTYR